jgi:putative flippase GtrA
MDDARAPRAIDAGREGRLAFRYMLASLTGFATDAAVLKGAMALGAGAAAGRALSLATAMQVTFLVNGFLVFRSIDKRSWKGQWLRYMATGAVANTGNYFIFVTLVSLHAGLISNRWTALGISSVLAWCVNYVCTRLLVFHGRHEGPRPAA